MNDSGFIRVTQDSTPIVPLDQIVGGGPPRDGIPSIDNPKFESVQEADEFLDDGEFVVCLIRYLASRFG